MPLFRIVSGAISSELALPFTFMSYHAEFGRSTSKGVGIAREEPPKLGCAGAPPPVYGAWLIHINTPLPNVGNHAKVDRC